MTDTPMTAGRFAALLDAYGADPARWPEAERAAAQAFAAIDPAAPALLAQAAELDSLMDLPAATPADVRLRDAIIASAGAKPAPRRSVWWIGAGFGAALAGAAAGALTIGVMAPGLSNELSVDPVAGATTVFGSIEEGAAP